MTFLNGPKLVLQMFEVVRSNWQIVSWRYDVIIGSFQHLIKIEARPFFLVRGWQVFTQYSSFSILPIRALTFSIHDAILWCRYLMITKPVPIEPFHNQILINLDWMNEQWDFRLKSFLKFHKYLSTYFSTSVFKYDLILSVMYMNYN